MPYFWSRICNIYKDETPEGWDTSNNAILSDLAWFVIEDESNPRALFQAVQDSYDTVSYTHLTLPTTPYV